MFWYQIVKQALLHLEFFAELLDLQLYPISSFRYFDFDKSMLRSVHKKELERTAIMLKRMPNLMQYIEGHTDQRGDEEYNKALSERRADAVKAYLTKRGIEENRMEETWFGETRPVHDCNEVTCTPAMHQLNRRTELRVGKSQFTYSGRQKKVDVM